jgi:hypothetical protein
MTTTAAGYAALGFALLFLPGETAAMLGQIPGNTPVYQLLAAALLGFAAMNWVARGSALGGIYGRAVVAGNQAHLTIGALLLARLVIDDAAVPPLVWAVTTFYVFGAAYFAYLTFFSSGIGKQS